MHVYNLSEYLFQSMSCMRMRVGLMLIDDVVVELL